MARAALAGGAKIVQLRDKSTQKSASTRQIVTIARSIREWTRQNHALFLVNDDVELALKCDADGVHLGEDDMPLMEARARLGPQKIIGVSAATPAQARAAERDGANYLGVGAVFGTQTKLDAGAPIGIEGLRAVVDATTLPVAAIGGVNAANIASVWEAGAQMACVISALCQRFDADSTKNEEFMEARAREMVALAAGAGR